MIQEKLDVIKSVKQSYIDSFKEMNRQKKEMIKTLQGNFSLLFSQIFEEDSTLESIGWRQYTDYFNDGEPCKFAVRVYDGEGVYLNGEALEDLWVDEDKVSAEEWAKFSTRERQALDVCRVLNEIGEDVLHDIFGDHAKVTCYKDRVKVSWCNHD